MKPPFLSGFIDGVELKLSHKSILDPKKGEIKNVYSGDGEMLRCLEQLLAPYSDGDTVSNALKQKGEQLFITPSGRRINRVTLKAAPGYTYKLEKKIPENGTTVLNAANYYCVELYYDKRGGLNMRGITYGELVRTDGKLWLSEQSILPEDYERHYMYLHKWDYITIYDNSGTCKFSGYYTSVYDIKSNRICYAFNATETAKAKSGKAVGKTISKSDRTVKRNVDILGKMGGEIKCGVPLLSITERE